MLSQEALELRPELPPQFVEVPGVDNTFLRVTTHREFTDLVGLHRATGTESRVVIDYLETIRDSLWNTSSPELVKALETSVPDTFTPNYKGLCDYFTTSLIRDKAERLAYKTNLHRFSVVFDEGNTPPDTHVALAVLFMNYAMGEWLLTAEQELAVHAIYESQKVKSALEFDAESLKEGIEHFQESTLQAMPLAEQHLAAKRLKGARYILADRLYLRNLWHPHNDQSTNYEVISTSEVRAVDKRPPLYIPGAQYNAELNEITLPLDAVSRPTFLAYMAHEIRHSMSPTIYRRMLENGFSYAAVKRVGFMTIAKIREDARIVDQFYDFGRPNYSKVIIMHTNLSEGFNDYKARTDNRLDPIANTGPYPKQRAIVGKLIEMTGGVELWDNFYNVMNIDDKAARQASFRDLNRALNAVGGKGFLNRLDTTWALYGADYVLAALERGDYASIKYYRPSDLPRLALEQELASSEEIQGLIREPVPADKR